METTTIFEQRVALTPKDLNRVAGTPIEKLLIEKAEQVLEGKCTKNGYVIPGSLKMISRSMGQVDPGRFTGAFVYFIQVEGKVLYPTDGMILQIEVMRKNKMGIFGEYNAAIRVMLPRDLHLGNDDYDNINIGDKIQVLVKKSRFQINDPFILSVGILYSSDVVVADADAVNTADESSDEE
jgi:hypothetical protein